MEEIKAKVEGLQEKEIWILYEKVTVISQENQKF